MVKIIGLESGYQAEAVRGIDIFPCNGRGNTDLDDRLSDWWQMASALAPLQFRAIDDQGLPSNKRRRNKRMTDK